MGNEHLDGLLRDVESHLREIDRRTQEGEDGDPADYPELLLQMLCLRADSRKLAATLRAMIGTGDCRWLP